MMRTFNRMLGALALAVLPSSCIVMSQAPKPQPATVDNHDVDEQVSQTLSLAAYSFGLIDRVLSTIELTAPKSDGTTKATPFAAIRALLVDTGLARVTVDPATGRFEYDASASTEGGRSWRVRAQGARNASGVLVERLGLELRGDNGARRVFTLFERQPTDDVGSQAPLVFDFGATLDLIDLLGEKDAVRFIDAGHLRLLVQADAVRIDLSGVSRTLPLATLALDRLFIVATPASGKIQEANISGNLVEPQIPGDERTQTDTKAVIASLELEGKNFKIEDLPRLINEAVKK